MATLTHTRTRWRNTLRGRHLVGRSRRCDLYLPWSDVSGEHALLSWNGTAWVVRDLASRNGTFVDGMRIDPGLPVTLEKGVHLGFGEPEGQWTLDSDTPPVPIAVDLDGVEVEGTLQMLLLPSAGAPQAMVYQGPRGRWMLDGLSGVAAIEDRHQVVLGDSTWIIHLPQPYAETRDRDALILSRTHFFFRVSADEEHIELAVEVSGQVLRVRPRAHTYLLVTLARKRFQDAQAGLPPSEQGWMYRSDLTKGLKMSENKLNVHVFRARRQLEEAGLVDAAGVIERRLGSDQLRIGVRTITIKPL